MVALLAAAGTAVAGLALLDSYRPSPITDPEILLPEAVVEVQRWIDAHDLLVRVFLVAGIAVLLGLAFAARGGGLSARRAVVAALAVAVAIAAALTTIVTTDDVRYDQVALWAVTVGTEMTGYEVAASGDDVRFVLVDGREVSTSEYRRTAVLHLGAPFVGAAALVVALVALLRRAEQGPRRRIVAAEPAATA